MNNIYYAASAPLPVGSTNYVDVGRSRCLANIRQLKAVGVAGTIKTKCKTVNNAE